MKCARCDTLVVITPGAARYCPTCKAEPSAVYIDAEPIPARRIGPLRPRTVHELRACIICRSRDNIHVSATAVDAEVNHRAWDHSVIMRAATMEQVIKNWNTAMEVVA